uniref:Uncharacterized protein n=1 Tax=Oreochromis aureus TaxID=47969 RepID=A0A668VA87_OREAU
MLNCLDINSDLSLFKYIFPIQYKLDKKIPFFRKNKMLFNRKSQPFNSIQFY